MKLNNKQSTWIKKERKQGIVFICHCAKQSEFCDFNQTDLLNKGKAIKEHTSQEVHLSNRPVWHLKPVTRLTVIQQCSNPTIPMCWEYVVTVFLTLEIIDLRAQVIMMDCCGFPSLCPSSVLTGLSFFLVKYYSFNLMNSKTADNRMICIWMRSG